MVEDNLLLLEISNLPKKLDDNETETVSIINDEDSSSISSDDTQLQELREARLREAQMEKTVKWWSECTANWREKWSTVKNERNKAKDEVKTLKTKLETANRDLFQLKKDRNDLNEENLKLKKDVERLDGELKKERPAFVPPLRILDGAENEVDTIVVKTALNNETEVENTVPIEGKLLENSCVTDSAVFSKVCEKCPELENNLISLQSELTKVQEDLNQETSAKEGFSDRVDELTAEIETLKGKIQEEELAKEKAIIELNRFKEKRRGSAMKDGEERKAKDLRLEIEKLQKENAVEWNKREKLQSEKLASDRETKKLRHQVEDLQRELRLKVEEAGKSVSFQMKQLQTELEDSKKELSDLKTTHLKLKKIYQDKKDDVIHTKTRVDHHEDEIKKLRGRIDDLKQVLTATQDEVDHKDSLARKLQRAVDEKTQECDVLQVQLGHLQNRWKKMTLTARIPRSSSDDNTDLSEEDKQLLDLEFMNEDFD